MLKYEREYKSMKRKYDKYIKIVQLLKDRNNTIKEKGRKIIE
jgi:hypothetical protein